MKWKMLLPVFAALPGLMFASAAFAQTTLRVISDRTPSHLGTLFEYYQQQTGVRVDAVFVKQGLNARLKSRPTEADVVITKAANLLELAKGQGVLQPYSSDVIDSTVAPQYRDPDRQYIVTSFRPRSIFASRARVEPGSVVSYDDLLDTRWKGRVCIRSGYHAYNISLFSQMAADRGLYYTRWFISGLHANLARSPKGNDRAQVRAIYQDQCDLSIGNSYYMPLMLERDDQRPWGEASYLVFPNQTNRGAYLMRSGAALTRAQRNVPAATRFLEFLVSAIGQDFVVKTTYEYPVKDGIALPGPVKVLGREQGITDGGFMPKVVPLAPSVAMRNEVVKILDEVDFDRK